MSRKNHYSQLSRPSPSISPHKPPSLDEVCISVSRFCFSRRFHLVTALLLLLIALLAFPFPARAQTLHGVVLGRNGEKKPFVSVNIAGVRRVLTRTGQDGGFTVGPLPAGSYLVTIREGRNRQEFYVTIQDGENPETFQLGW